MAKRPEQDTAPKNWTPTQAVPEPILNNPYAEPTAYWNYTGGVPSQMPGRRPASYFYKTKRTGAADADMSLFREETSDDLPLVNALRKDVKR